MSNAQKPHSSSDSVHQAMNEQNRENMRTLIAESNRWELAYVEARNEIARLEEQNEDLRDLLRGFLYDADNGDRPGPGLRDAARKALDG